MKPELKAELNKIREEFTISNSTLNKIATDFYSDMTEKTMLRMLKTYVFMNTDKILEDEYLTIDLGGTNIRISKIKVLEGKISIEKIIKIPLRTPLVDYTTNKYSLKNIFIMTLKKMMPFLEKDKLYTLAATVSFELKSEGKDKAKIVELSKGFDLADTLGEDIYKILIEAIEELKLKIIPSLIINDCVATLATGKFYYPNADIGFIVGTGHNGCFIDETGEIINIESANFNKELPLTIYDNKYLDKLPKIEAEKLFEVLIGGKYIGGIANEIVKSLVQKGLLKESKPILTEDLTKILDGENLLKYSAEQKEVIEEIAKILFSRAAKFIVSEIVGILMQIDKDLERKHTVVFDGSVYEKCEFFREEISNNLESIFMDNANKLSHKLIKDASSIGPAIVSASSK